MLESDECNKSPGIVHDVLHYLVQNLLEERRPDPDVFDGLGRERLRGATGGGGSLPPQRFMSNALGSSVGHKAQAGHYYQQALLHTDSDSNIQEYEAI